MLPDSTTCEQTVSVLVDGLFRRESGRLTSVLTRRLGFKRLDAVQDAVQDAFEKALHNWPYCGIPANPAGWMMRVAHNRAIDSLRSEIAGDHAAEALSQELAHQMSNSAPELYGEATIQDDQLRMMFLCCHPSLPVASRVALTLKTLCGFSVDEIALGLRIESATVAKRITRAKRTLRSLDTPFEFPDASCMGSRLDSVLYVLYLLFNEGYCPHSGHSVVHANLCDDAIYIANVLSEHPVGNCPVVFALLALMLLQASRLDARSGPGGILLLLEEQDRARWDKARVAAGFACLRRAGRGSDLTRYHIEAGIAACHAAAGCYAATDWQAICSLYDLLMEHGRSPIAALNRAVAIGMRDGGEAGLNELECLRPALSNYYLLHAVSGHMRLMLNDLAGAKADYTLAFSCRCNAQEKALIWRRLSEASIKYEDE